MSAIRIAQSIVLALVSVVGTVSIASAHPFEDCDLFDWPEHYGAQDYGYSNELEVSGIQFVDRLPLPETLTPAEQYIVCGGKNRRTGLVLRPWIKEVMMHTSAYFAKEHKVPSALDEDAFAVLSSNGSNYTEITLERMKSPITGRFPRMDSAEFSAGDLYVRDLTMAEMRRLASVNQLFQNIWFQGQWVDPEGETQEVRLDTPVFYVRVYGRNAVIYESLYFEWHTVH